MTGLLELTVIGEGLPLDAAKAAIDWPQRLRKLRLMPLELPDDLDLTVRETHPDIQFQNMTLGPEALERRRSRMEHGA